MAGYYPQPGQTLGGHPDPRFGFQSSEQLMADSRMAGVQDHLGGVAFWYRPDTSLPVVERHDIAHVSHGAMTSIEAVKHRRTRSGCFTCRSRRVKCDEARPVCDRCRKGNRECEFPKPQSSSKTGSRTKAGRNSFPSRSNMDSPGAEDDDVAVLETIKDESEEKNDDEGEEMLSKTRSGSSAGKPRKQSALAMSRKQKYRHHADSVTASRESARSPSTDSSASTVSSAQTPASSIQPSTRATPFSRSSWAHLRKDLQKYLSFHQDYITNFHYIMKYDASDFFHTELIELALTYEPLLYAVVGFAAYYHTLRQPEGKLSHFLPYYSRSLSVLRQDLTNDGPRTEATILTILQLATFEEHMGDWPNLIGHHQAAHEMFIARYDMETVMETELSRQIFAWYARFDLMAGFLAGSQPLLPREWYAFAESWYEAHVDREDVDIENNIYAFASTQRLIGLDMAGLFAKLPRRLISLEDFIAESEIISQRMASLRKRIEALNDGYYTVTEYPKKRPLGPSDIVNPYLPGGLFRDALYPLNYSWMDWYGSEIMRQYQTAAMLQQQLPTGLEGLALEQCRIYETIDQWDESPRGSTLGAIAGIGISALFLPKDDRHTMWCRKKLAAIEQDGYVYPTAFRTKMAELWHLPEINHWWLPDEEGFTPLLRNIRAFIKERAMAYEASKGDAFRDDLRDMKAVFSKLNIEESPRSTPSESSGSGNHGPSP